MRLNFIIQGTPLLSWRNCNRILDQSKDKQNITVENSDISHICPGNHNSVKLNLSELDCQADATILRNSEWRLSTAEVGKGLKKKCLTSILRPSITYWVRLRKPKMH